MSGRVCVFIATSLDGFIAGPDDDLSWLPTPSGDPPPDFGYGAFMDGVGALLMGRNTFEVVAGFEGAWPYAERPVLVATHRPLQTEQPTVRAAGGTIHELVQQAITLADGRDVYLDGGAVIRQAVDAGLVDTLTITMVPVILGAGSPLFAGVEHRTRLTLIGSETLGEGLVQLRYGRTG